MHLLIRHDGTIYRAEVIEHLSSDMIRLCILPGNMTAQCFSTGSVNITAPGYQGFGSWDVDHVTPGMEEYFLESVDTGEFTNEHGEVEADLLAESTADGFELFNRDGSMPTWLTETAERIVAEWRQSHG